MPLLTSQGNYGGHIIIATYIKLFNGTKRQLSNDCFRVFVRQNSFLKMHASNWTKESKEVATGCV